MNYFFHLTLILSLIVLSSCSTGKKFKTDIPTEYQKSETIEHKNDIKQSPTPIKKIQTNNYLDFCYPLCPVNMAKTNIQVNHEDFFISYNVETKYADWVAYKINPNNLLGTTKKRIWKADPKIPLETAIIPSDYKDAYVKCNYDRGHQAPLADFSNSIKWERVNYLSNITPQKSKLNRGPWNNLESKIRLLGKEKAKIYVITGPYYNGKPTCQLPNARISNLIPNGYWKIVTVIKNNDIYRASFKFDQDTPKDANFCNYLTSVNDISKITKLDFKIRDGIDNSLLLLQKLGCNSPL